MAGAAQAPDEEVRQATDRLRTLIQQHHDEYKAKPDAFYKVVDREVVPHFDQQYIGQIVLGRYWRSASEPQRRRFINAFKNALVHSYADALLDNYNTVEATWKPVHAAPDATDATVDAELTRQGAQPVQLGFSVRKVGDQWKVYDVIVDGVSLAANFRSQFSQEIKQNGLDSLIRRLETGGKPLQDASALGKKKP
ncbi:MAG TPA: ABC transporter substrate-binding protein [Nevskiaceae bacterium]|nr:ABC transporter substrate-binding protein [Nevskiaceae bacterium]